MADGVGAALDQAGIVHSCAQPTAELPWLVSDHIS